MESLVSLQYALGICWHKFNTYIIIACNFLDLNNSTFSTGHFCQNRIVIFKQHISMIVHK